MGNLIDIMQTLSWEFNVDRVKTCLCGVECDIDSYSFRLIRIVDLEGFGSIMSTLMLECSDLKRNYRMISD